MREIQINKTFSYRLGRGLLGWLSATAMLMTICFVSATETAVNAQTESDSPTVSFSNPAPITVADRASNKPETEMSRGDRESFDAYIQGRNRTHEPRDEEVEEDDWELV